MDNLFKIVEFSREPTPFEIKQGYGARHYKRFPLGMVIKDANQHNLGLSFRIVKRIKCPIDKLIYTRS